jgi:hypothetical protein
MTPPGISGGADRPDPFLNRLRDRAASGEITVGQFHKGMRDYVERNFVVPRRNSDMFLRDIDTEDVASDAVANVVVAKGELLDGFEPIASYLKTTADNLLNDKRARRRNHGWLPPLSLDAPVLPDEREGARGREITSEGTPAWARNAADENTVMAAVLIGEAQGIARRRIVAFINEAGDGGHCLFHPSAPCPQRVSLFPLLSALIRQDPLMDLADRKAYVKNWGRDLGLSSRGHELERDLRRCFDWWWYRAFRGTELDPVSRRDERIGSGLAADLLRLPIVERLRLKPGGGWDSEHCSVKAARKLILAVGSETYDPEFARLLRERDLANETNMYDLLKGRAK